VNAKTLLSAAVCVGAACFLGCGFGNPEPEPAEEIENEIDGPLGPMETSRFGTGFDPAGRQFLQYGQPANAAPIHGEYYEDFIRQPGAGFGRLGPPPPPAAHWVELVAESQGDRKPDAAQPTDELPAASYDELTETLTYPDGTKHSVRERVWLLRDRQLVSVDAKSGPAVYLQSPKTQDELAKSAKTRATAQKRPPDDFETAALVKLRAGDDVALQASDRTLRVLGAIRARSQCLECHKVEEGTMLGAFSYTLKLQSEATAKADRLADKAGLTDQELGAIQVVESRGGKVIRAPGGPVTELQLSFARKREIDAKGSFNQFGPATSPTTRLQLRDSGLRLVGAFPELLTLDVSHSLVSDAGLKSIAELKHLKKLDLTDTSVTEAGIAELKKALPECEILCPEILP